MSFESFEDVNHTLLAGSSALVGGTSSGSDEMVSLTIDGRVVTVPEGVTLWDAAKDLGIEVPVLCHSPGMEPTGVCRMCVVDVGQRVLAAACHRACDEGMIVETASAKVEKHRRQLLQLLIDEHPVPCERERTTGDCELEALAVRYGVVKSEEEQSEDVGVVETVAGESCLDNSSPVIAVDHSACILCDRCVRACDDLQSNHVIGRSGKGAGTSIGFDLNDPMGESSCVSCGECVAACPTGALTNKVITLPILPVEQLDAVETLCPYCGVGCSVTYYTGLKTGTGCKTEPGCKTDTADAVETDEAVSVGTVALEEQMGDSARRQIVFGEGRESPVNHGRLCVKGRYGWDYSMHPQRLTTPLIRRESAYPKGGLSPDVQSSLPRKTDGGKTAGSCEQKSCDQKENNGKGGRKKKRRAGGIVNDADVLPAFREASWDEVFALIAERFQTIKTEHGGNALAGFGSAKCSNEEAYLFQKLIRAGFGTNNIDHCTRLCHASSVAALMETIGSGAVTNLFADVVNSDVALLTGTNTTANHPVAATFMKEAVKNGTKLIVVDVRRHPMADFATHFAQIRPGSDVAFYNGVMHVLIRDGLVDERFVADRTEGFAELKALLLSEYSPRKVAAICGVAADEIEAIAWTIGGKDCVEKNNGAELPRMLVFWGMGISQHTHGTDNARCLISLCLLTGNVGKSGTGLHPLRGQNNVQGASDAGLIPMVFPDYQSVADVEIREKFERAWGVSLDSQPGLTVVEIMHEALSGDIRGMYIMGENPFISDPNSNVVRQALSNLDFLVVQDIFLTETAEFADVILPAGSFFEKDGTYTNTDRRVQVGRAVLDLPGDAKNDWEIVCEIGRRMGVSMPYDSPADVFDEFAALTNNYRGLSHDNLGSTGKLWPCADPATGDGTKILFGDRFPTANGLGKFVACHFQPADELPDPEYRYVLNTGRVLEHWHTGSMTRRSYALSSISPRAVGRMHPEDLLALGMGDGGMARVSSRRGEIELSLLADRSIQLGSLFIPFHFREAAANVLTTDALDPDGKIPEYKFCAVKIRPIAAEVVSETVDG